MRSGRDIEVTDALLEAVGALDRARRAAGLVELRVTNIDHVDPDDAELDGWTLYGLDVIGRHHYASEAQGLIGASL